MLSSPLCLGLPSGLCSAGIPTRTLFSRIHAVCPATHRILLDVVTWIVFGDEYQSLKCLITLVSSANHEVPHHAIWWACKSWSSYHTIWRAWKSWSSPHSIWWAVEIIKYLIIRFGKHENHEVLIIQFGEHCKSLSSYRTIWWAVQIMKSLIIQFGEHENHEVIIQFGEHANHEVLIIQFGEQWKSWSASS